jgi:hypothetical protein
MGGLSIIYTSRAVRKYTKNERDTKYKEEHDVRR